jgi:hypothetical protein
MATKIDIEKIELALCDPQAPWYASDLVSMVADLIEAYKEMMVRLTPSEKGNNYGR